MSYDVDILRAMAERKVYERFRTVIKEDVLSNLTFQLFQSIGDYFNYYPEVETINWDDFSTYFFIVRGKAMKPDKKLQYELVLNNITTATSPISSTVEDALARFIELDYANRIGLQLNDVINKGMPLEGLKTTLESFEMEKGRGSVPPEDFVPPSLSYITEVASSPGLNWRLDELNVSAGPLRKGDFAAIAGFVNTGKTTAAISEATYMLDQLAVEKPLIWVNNEEASVKVMARLVQSYYGITSKDLLSNTKYYEGKFNDDIGSKLLVTNDDSSFDSVYKLDKLFRKHPPGLVVFDQLDKVKGFEKECNGNEYLRLGMLWKWARGIAKTYCPVIAISQVNGEGATEKWLGMQHLRGSKVDKPAELDLLITIGIDFEPGTDPLKRYLHVAKNKLFGSATTVEAERHGFYEVRINPTIARYEGKKR